MAYDLMGNYTGEDDYTDYSAPVAPVEPIGETEEERRKRLEEERKRAEAEAKRADQSVAHEQKVITYENGSKTVETKQEIPAGLKLQPVNPNAQGQDAEKIRLSAQKALTDPAAAAYNARIAQQESGANPNIGYHDQTKSSAYGPYGMTNAGYEDARKINPSLPQDITQASPEQQTQAQNAYTQQNAKYLQNYGVEPTQQNLAAAHFLGAKGLSDYMKTGYISPQAAAANGGAENVKRIVDQRLGGQAAPASGAAQQRPQPVQPVAPQAQQPSTFQGQTNEFGGMEEQPQAQPVAPVSPEQAQAQAPQNMYSLAKPQAQPTNTAGFIEQYQTNQNDPAALFKLGTDENVPDALRERARNRAADIITQQREQAKAQADLVNKSPSDLARMMTERKKDGSWGKYILFGALGMTALRDEEAGKLGIGSDKIVTGADGKGYLIKIGANGAPLEGFNDQGRALTAEELITAAAGAGAGKVSTSAEQFQDKDGNIYRTQSDEKGRLVTRNVVTNEVYRGDPTKLTRVRDIATQTAAEQKQGYRRENDATSFGNSIRKLDYDSKLKAVAEFRQAAINRGEPDLTDAELSAMGVERPDIGRAQAAPAQAAPTLAAPGKVMAPVAPQAQAGQAPTAVAPVAPGTSVTGRMTPEAQKQQEAQAKLQREAESQVSVDARKDFNGYVDKEVVAKVPNATKISRIRSQQLDGPDGLINVPEVAGIMAGGGSAGREVGNIIRDMITGQFTSTEDLNKRVVGLGLQNSNPKVYNALMMQIRLQQELGPLTIKDTAPTGAISDSEQKMNTSNQIDPTRNPAYVTFNLLSKNKFNTDMTQAKADFVAKNPDLNTIAKFNQAWTKEEGRLYKQYDDIYAARAAYVGEYKNTPAAAVAAYKLFPVPAWNAEQQTWQYKGQPYAKKRPGIDSFVTK